MKFRILAICFAPVLLFGQDLQTDFQTIGEDFNLVGASLITFCNGEVNYYGYGVENISTNVATDQNTHYRIASVSKLITAIGAMHMAGWQVALDLDADISTYLGYEVRNPNFPEDSITMRMLLSHTSTLVDGDGYFDILPDVVIISFLHLLLRNYWFQVGVIIPLICGLPSVNPVHISHIVMSILVWLLLLWKPLQVSALMNG